MTRYAILGGGRLARHMHHYLGLLGQACSGWARDRESPLNTHQIADGQRRLLAAVEDASHVLLLVSDAAIGTLVRQYPFLHGKKLIHCAGALSLPGIAGAHPLMTFADNLYSLRRYQAIPFVVEDGYRFEDLFPALPNPAYTVRVEHKALYHALCVMAGNFPQILWRAVSERMEGDLGLPPGVLNPYLRQAQENFTQAPDAALTGPLSRGEQMTVERNLAALAGDDLHSVYLAFAALHERRKGELGRKERAS